MDTAALKLEGLSKCYGGFCALDNVHLEIARGEIFALLGPNGAGKTTLIGCIGGTAKKTSGKAYVFGMDLDKDAKKIRQEIGLVHQEVNYDAVFTPRETLAFQMGYYGMRKNAAYIKELLETLFLTDKADVPIRNLSGGMKRRTMIAKALVHKPKLLFLDEPTAGVDTELRQELWNYVRYLKEQGTTIVLTTHYLEEAEALADRVGVLSHGRLAVVDEKNHLLSSLGTRKMTLKLAAPFPRPFLGDLISNMEAKFVTIEEKAETLAGDRHNIQLELSPDGRQLTIFQINKHPNFAQTIAFLSEKLYVEDIQIQNPRMEDVVHKVLHASDGTLQQTSQKL